MNLVYYPDPILKKELADVNIENPGFDPIELKEQMTQVMLEKRGLGLSACQVGLDHKLFIMGEKEGAIAMFINPEVISVSEEEVLDTEGCLSFPDVFVQIKRPQDVIAKWYDENLNPQSGTITGYGARCFLHEYDHLHGVVYKDKTSHLKWDRALKKKGKIAKQRAKMMNYLSMMKQFEATQTQQKETVAEQQD
jgi:peptide deformylase